MPEVAFFADARGNEPVHAYIEKVSQTRAADAASMLRYIDLLEDKGERLQYPFASLIDKDARIFELRPGPHRVAYALHRGTYILLHAWRKQTQRLDQRQVTVARSRLADWSRRHPGRNE